MKEIEDGCLAVASMFGYYVQTIAIDEGPVESGASHVALATLCVYLEKASVPNAAGAAFQDSADFAVPMPGILSPTGFFDPAGLPRIKTSHQLVYAHDAQLEHGRIAMLAALGIPFAGAFHPVYRGTLPPLISHFS